MQCKICQASSQPQFTAQVLNKYAVQYFHCDNCGFLQTEEPHWLAEAYQDSMNLTDTGILLRNQQLAQAATVLLYYQFDRHAKFLDYAGGYGVFTRLMRDIGFDFYWHDPYTKNVLARGFEGSLDHGYELLTSFESFEHFVEPLAEIEKMLTSSKNIFFSTELLPNPVPQPKDWWYYGLEHGQHVAFYSMKTLEYIAKHFGLHMYSFGIFHLLTEKTIHPRHYEGLMRASQHNWFLNHVKKSLVSKTFTDMTDIIAKLH